MAFWIFSPSQGVHLHDVNGLWNVNTLASINFEISAVFASRLRKKKSGISKLVDEEAVLFHKPRKEYFYISQNLIFSTNLKLCSVNTSKTEHAKFNTKFTQGRRNLVKTGWAKPQILTTSTVATYKLHPFCNFEGFFASDIWKTAHPGAPPLFTITRFDLYSCIVKPNIRLPWKIYYL